MENIERLEEKGLISHTERTVVFYDEVVIKEEALKEVFSFNVGAVGLEHPVIINKSQIEDMKEGETIDEEGIRVSYANGKYTFFTKWGHEMLDFFAVNEYEDD